MNTEEWINVADAAKQLEVTERHVRRLCEREKLAYQKEGNVYLIDPESLSQYVSETSKERSAGRTSTADAKVATSDMNRTSEKEEDITRTFLPDMGRTSSADMDQLPDMLPADITVLLHKLRASKQAVRTLHDEMSDTVDLIVRLLDYEYRRNQEVQNTLTHLLKGLRIPVDPITKRSHKWFYIVLTLFILIAAGFLALFFSGFAPCHRLVEVIRNIV